MHKDPNLRKRNALVIPGGLLALTAFIGIAYVAVLRGDEGTCEDSGLIVFLGACRSAMLLLAIPLIIGLALVASGALGFRSKATCRHGWGSWAHFGLAVLIAMVLVPALGIVTAPSLVGPDAAITRGGVDYPVTTVLAGITLVGVIALVPYLSIYVARGRANPCCHEKGCFEPCFCDEPIAPEGALPTGVAPVGPEDVPSLQPPPEPEPAQDTEHQVWSEAPPAPAEPEPAAEQWESLPEPEPEPARAKTVAVPPPEPAPTRPLPRAAPALASRPTDPAAPPQDEMAIAAKWKEEDAEAAAELARTRSEPPAREYAPASNTRRERLATEKRQKKAAKAARKKR